MTDCIKELYDKIDHLNITKMGGNKKTEVVSSIMQPIENLPINEEYFHDIRPNIPKDEEIKLETPFQSLPLEKKGDSFLLIDQEGNLKIDSVEEFIHNLDCTNNCKLKVISIVGNSGDGKSYTLNHLFFRGHEKFKTSKYAEGGTRGIWAAYQPAQCLLCLDTPPLHHPNSKLLLMKVLAISDLVIYRTRSERLSEDLFNFLGEATKANTENFQSVLQKVGHRVEIDGPVSSQGPAIFINHEPLHSFPLVKNSKGEEPREQILAKFKAMGWKTDGMGMLCYVSTPPPHSLLVSSSELPIELKKCLGNSAVRMPRSPGDVLNALKVLSKRFKSRLTCDIVCEVCHSPCCLSMGHETDGTEHISKEKCRYERQYNNKELTCRRCLKKVEWVEPTKESWLSLARPVWDSYELHCPECGPIYKSKQYWFGNKSPEETVVIANCIHVWPGQNTTCRRFSVGARRALESVSGLVGTAYNLSTDYIAPSYWQPNSEIKNCNVCNCTLNNGWGEIHHCRACGKGVCSGCSKHRAPVPKFGWNDPVRICDSCKESNINSEPVDDVSVTPRKVTEVVASTLSPLSVVLNYPKGMLTELARPAYWIPDEEAPRCAGCDLTFGTSSEGARHHCRQCGQSVCNACSPNRRPVPERGWTSPVRVCKKCCPKM